MRSTRGFDNDLTDAARGRRVWLACVVVSLLAHAAVTVVVVQMPVSAAANAPLAVERGHEDVRVRPMMIFPADEPARAEAAEPPRDAPSAMAEVIAPEPERDRPMVIEEPKREEAPQPVTEPLMVAALGVEGGLVDARSWLKSVTEGEHGAEMSTVEQPRLDRDATPSPQGPTGEGGERGGGGSPAAAMMPPGVIAPDAATPKDQAEQEEKAAREAQAERAAQEAREAQAAREAVAAAGTSGGEKPREAARPAQELVVAQPEVKAQPAVPAQEALPALPKGVTRAVPEQVTVPPTSEQTSAQVSPQPAANGAANGTAPGAPGAPGSPTARQTVAADRDSDAFTLKRSAVFRNGRVDAGEGLDIRTVRPEFSILTRAIVPRSAPTVEITFAKTGRVRSVRLVQSSGYKVELDDPVIAAAYNWRASGKALRELPDHPEAGVKLTVVMLIN